VSTFKIERGIPLPTTTPQHKYPWRHMEIGDSFLVRTRRDAERACRSARQYADYYRLPFRTSYRAVSGGHRIWRTK
jgi:hypothetical protein